MASEKGDTSEKIRLLWREVCAPMERVHSGLGLRKQALALTHTLTCQAVNQDLQ